MSSVTKVGAQLTTTCEVKKEKEQSTETICEITKKAFEHLLIHDPEVPLQNKNISPKKSCDEKSCQK